MNFFHELVAPLAEWGSLDTWIVVTGALAAMACALPGNFLVLRQQSMMGDALSHTALPGIAIAFLATHALRTAGLIGWEPYSAAWHAAMFAGAVVLGILTAVFTEAIQKLGHVESSAALGVVFTTLFALGLILIRLAADRVHLDADCVLYGSIETVVMDTCGTSRIPRAAVVNGAMLVVNLGLVVLCFKELRVAAFDANLATTLGIDATKMHYALMAVTAATLVAAFESVGSILVIAMLIVPAATAYLLTDRLSSMIVWSLGIAAASAIVGHVAAITLPAAIFKRLGFDTVVDASTAGMTAVAGGMLFVLALVISPKQGLLVRAVRQNLLGLRVACEDVLGLLYRLDEMQLGGSSGTVRKLLGERRGGAALVQRLALYKLAREGKIATEAAGYRLTEAGRRAAEELVRSHRLWETYLERHFNDLSGAKLHRSAHAMEHFIGPDLREELAVELDRPATDPHGKNIPPHSSRED